SLTNGLIGQDSKITDPQSIVASIERALAMLDADGSGGDADPATDGFLIMRHLLGFKGSTLTTGVLGENATRDAGEITSFLNLYSTPDPQLTDVGLAPESDTEPQGD